MAVTMKGAVFCHVRPLEFFKNCLLEEHIASIIKIKRISELQTTLAVTGD
jgi:hypothetical protein